MSAPGANPTRRDGGNDAIDPTETLAASDFRTSKSIVRSLAKALFGPWLKRDIVTSIACTRPRAGGLHGKPHRTTKILSHARRRGCVAARGARAAAGQAA